MAGPYGDTTHIRQLLNKVEDTTPETAERLDALNETISLLIEDKLDMIFGEPAADSTVLFWAKNSDALVLPRPVRSITTITVGGTVSGGTMTGGTVYSPDLWTPDVPDQYGLIRQVRLLSGGWWGAGMPVTVTGQWARTDADAEVPKEIVSAVDGLVSEFFKLEQASPAGFTGPEGATVPIRDPWKHPLWLAVQAKYGSPRELVV